MLAKPRGLAQSCPASIGQREPRDVQTEEPEKRRLSTRSIAWIVVTLLFAGLALVTVVSQPEPGEIRVSWPLGFDLQGHRGARGLAPENSLPGFEAALAIGVTTLELDTVMTRDGVIVVHHDRRLDPDRTRGAEGAWLASDPPPALIDLPASALRAYDVGRLRPESKVAERFPEQVGADGVTIPTLDQVLARAEALSGGRMRYNIETKISPLDPATSADPEAFARALAATLKSLGAESAGLVERAAVQSFDWRSLAALRDVAPDIDRVHLTAEQSWLDTLERGGDGASPWLGGLDIDRFDGSVARLVREAGGAVWSPFYRDLRKADLDEAHRLGLRVVVWTVNDPDDMASLIDLGVDGIITDYPDRLRKVMAEKGLALPPRYPAVAE